MAADQFDPYEIAERAARNAKRAAVFTGFCVLVAAVILALDHGIKRAILEATDEARVTVDKFKELARIENALIAGAVQEVRGAEAGEARATASAGDGAGSSVGDDSGTRTEAPANAAAGKRPAGRGKTGVRPGP